MPLSRRSFLGAAVRAPRAPSATFVAARGREAMEAGWAPPSSAAPAAPASRGSGTEIYIDSNENPVGPGGRAMEALVRAFEEAGRYPTNSRPSQTDLRATIARRLSVTPENVVLGSGSREVLRSAVRIHTSPS